LAPHGQIGHLVCTLDWKELTRPDIRRRKNHCAAQRRKNAVALVFRWRITRLSPALPQFGLAWLFGQTRQYDDRFSVQTSVTMLEALPLKMEHAKLPPTALGGTVNIPQCAGAIVNWQGLRYLHAGAVRSCP